MLFVVRLSYGHNTLDYYRTDIRDVGPIMSQCRTILSPLLGFIFTHQRQVYVVSQTTLMMTFICFGHRRRTCPQTDDKVRDLMSQSRPRLLRRHTFSRPFAKSVRVVR